ncbi:hypothetical protein DY000_02048444 [Brassica cretica]|uniref:Uncharacterized protein n=1 Tax=Brassica cretica TaxID=69181 RepID=A0ABQ7EV00_BRACR|nr:hypothetical protein DY000_02048444 [Brassica cretica]
MNLRADEYCASNLSVGAEKTLRGSSCKIRAAWALGSLGGTDGFRTRRLFLGNPWLLDPEVFDRTRSLWTLRRGHYRYLLGFRILPLGSWPLSSSRAARCFCRKPLSDLEGAGMGENLSARLTLLSTSGEAGYYRVLGFPGTLSLLNSWLVPYALDPRIAWGTDGFRTRRLFLGNPWLLDPKVFDRTRSLWTLRSFLGTCEATISTCWDFVFCRSEADHYRVPVLHAASAGSHYQT